ncbi:efflux RND transporter permease subunit [bacterium]|nr:efflux RND transporter permease subunit [bacterium]
MLNIWNFFLKKSSFSLLLIIALVFFGVFSVIIIPKESSPEVQIPIAIVTTIFPGAGAEDVEELVTDEVEEALNNNLDELNKITSVSREGVSVVIAEFNASADIDDSVREVKDEVEKIKRELPTDSEDPFVSEVNFVDQPIMLVSIASDLPVTKFIELAEDTVDELKSVKGVSKIIKSGIQEREVQVVVNKKQLHKFGMRLVDVVRALSLSNTSLPIGGITLDGIEYSVKFQGEIEKTSEIENMVIGATDGQPVYVRDVAFVSDGVSKTATFSRISVDGAPSEQAVTLSVFKKSGGDITKIAKSVREKLTELQNDSVLIDTTVLVALDTGELVTDDLRTLSLTGLQTIALVMVILFIAIGWREALIAGLAIPLSFLIGFVGLQITGNTINFVSLFALILAVGILVDSAIVVTEGTHTNMRDGLIGKDAARKTIKEFHWPLTSGTMTTIAVFAPLFFISGVTGEFIAAIPFTIIFVLIASLFVALGIIPLISAKMLKRRGVSQFEEKQEIYTTKIKGWYKTILRSILGNKKRENIFFVTLIILFIMALALPVTGVVKTIFFAQEDGDFIFVEIEKPQGTELAQTDLSVRAVEEILYARPNIESFVTTVGASSNFSNDASAGGGQGSGRLANITAVLKDKKSKTSTVISEELRKEFSVIRDAEVRLIQASEGPPTGAPVFIQFFGDNLNDLELAAEGGERLLKDIKGTREVETSILGDNIEFVLRVDRAKVAEVGLDLGTIAQTLRTAIHGATATTIHKDGEDIDVEVKLNLNANYRTSHDTSRTNMDSIRQIEIETPNGPVLLGSLTTASIEKSPALIRHEELNRYESVSSEIGKDVVAGDIVKEFKARVGEIGLAEGVIFKVGGETEDVDQSFKDMFVALIVGVLLVVSILVLQFNSFRYAVFIIAIVPLSLIGIFAGLLISGKALSFPSMMGYIALSGIVVNNAIILIDVINNLRKENSRTHNMTLRDIVIEGSASRLRPIVLTSLTTVIGIIPLTYASDLWSPLAFAIIFGLSFASIITLLLVPILYNRWPGPACRQAGK